ncbi:MAG: hypothetical protein ACTSYQ_00655, partial [Candidatus Odinarchaeia archaeon]
MVFNDLKNINQNKEKNLGESNVIREDLEIKIFDYLIIHRHGYSILEGKTNFFKLDQDLTSGLISAIILVSKELFKKSGGVKILDFGENKIVIESGNYLTIAVITGFVTSDLKNYLGDIIRYVEDNYSDIIANWTGEISELEGISNFINKALSPYV